MSLSMIHKAYMGVYKWSRFLARTDGRDGRDQPKVVQEVLADLKSPKDGIFPLKGIGLVNFFQKGSKGFQECVEGVTLISQGPEVDIARKCKFANYKDTISA